MVATYRQEIPPAGPTSEAEAYITRFMQQRQARILERKEEHERQGREAAAQAEARATIAKGAPLPGSPPSYNAILELIPAGEIEHPAAHKKAYAQLLLDCKHRENKSVAEMAEILTGTRLGQFIE